MLDHLKNSSNLFMLYNNGVLKFLEKICSFGPILPVNSRHLLMLYTHSSY